MSWPRGQASALLLGGILLNLLTACTEGRPMESTMQMSLRSEAFAEGGSIPTRFTCDGQDVSPPLSWGDEPEGTGSFVLIADDGGGTRGGDRGRGEQRLRAFRLGRPVSPVR